MASARAVQRRTSSSASSPIDLPVGIGNGAGRPGEIDARGAVADDQLDGPDGAVGSEQQRRGRAGGVDRDRDAAGRRRRGEIGPEGDGLADVGVGDSGEAAEVRGEGRSEERGVGEPAGQLFGDDGDLDAGGPRCRHRRCRSAAPASPWPRRRRRAWRPARGRRALRPPAVRGGRRAARRCSRRARCSGVWRTSISRASPGWRRGRGRRRGSRGSGGSGSPGSGRGWWSASPTPAARAGPGRRWSRPG